MANIIKKGATSFTLSAVMPDDFNPDTQAVKLTVVNSTTGDVYLDEEAVTLPASGTVTDDASGDYNYIVTSGLFTPEAGDTVIVGSDEEGWTVREVQSYDSVNSTIYFTLNLEQDVPAGSKVYSRMLNWTGDVSQWAGNLYVKWETDDSAFTQTWRVLEVWNQVEDLENQFRIAYLYLYQNINEQDFSDYVTRAQNKLKAFFAIKQIDFDVVVGSESFKELMLLELALLIGIGSSLSDEDYTRILKERDFWLELISNSEHWQDADEDGIEDEDEVSAAVKHNFKRGIW